MPPQTIGIIGGGQLGRMMAIAARYMGYRIAVLDPAEGCPTAQVADEHIAANYDDMEAIRKLADMSDVITYEFENVDLEAAAYLERMGKLPQGAYALEITQNREKEKTLIREMQLPGPAFAIVHNEGEAMEALKDFPMPAVIKTCRGGYDGKGQLKIGTETDVKEAAGFAQKHGHCIIEEWITFDKEISVIFTRSESGDIAFFPISENEHKNHILYKTTVPAKVEEGVRFKAYEAARTLAEKMDIVGTFAIEMFVRGEAIYLNEMAPRPHNSGHYSIEGCSISQFAQHIRAICGLPLAPVRLLMPTAMINILGEDMERALNVVASSPEASVHLYGKVEAKEKRKMGHITFMAETEEKLIHQLQKFKEEI